MTECTPEEVNQLNGNVCQSSCSILCQLLASPGEWRKVTYAEVEAEYTKKVIAEYEEEVKLGSTEEAPNPTPSPVDLADYLVNQADEEEIIIWLRWPSNQAVDSDYFFVRAISRY